MKNVKLLLLGLFVITAMFAYAQPKNTDYVLYKKYEGYIINNDGKRVDGHIYLDRDDKMQDKITFWKDPRNRKTKTVYKAGDIPGFFVADRLYESVPYGFTKKSREFMILEIDGQIKVYNRFTMSDEKGLEGGYIYKREDDKGRDGTKFLLNFSKNMSEYVKEHKELAEKVRTKQKGYRLLRILDIIQEYNAWYAENN